MGAAAVASLLRAGHAVTCVHRGKSVAPGLPERVTRVIADRGDRPAFATALASLAPSTPEVIIDMVGFDADAEHLLRALDALPSVRRVVFASSIDVYFSDAGLTSTSPVREEDPVRQKPWPKFDNVVYEKALFAAADAGRIEAVSLRLPAAYGPNDYQIREWFFVRRARDGRTRVALADGGLQVVSRGFAPSIGTGIAAAAVVPQLAQRIYHVGHRRAWTAKQIAEAAASACETSFEFVSVPAAWLPYSHPWQVDQPLMTDTSGAERDLGPHGYVDDPPQLEAMRQTVAWLDANPPATTPLGDTTLAARFDAQNKNAFDYAAEDAAIARAEASTGAGA
jgi:nucleoside-diphosphate-sugar epimerase